MRVCTQCSAALKESFKFCNQCGAPIDAENREQYEAQYYSRFQEQSGASLRLLRGAGTEGEYFSVEAAKTLGRGDADLRFGDMFLSQKHARVELRDGYVYVQDLGSLNGVFVRIRESCLLHNNAIFRAGDHYFLYEVFEDSMFSGDFQTQFYASPRRGSLFRLVEILAGGFRGRAICGGSAGLVVGSRDGDWIFSEDLYLSPRHFGVVWSEQGAVLVDKGSRNGVYLRINTETALQHGDMFFVGAELLSVNNP